MCSGTLSASVQPQAAAEEERSDSCPAPLPPKLNRLQKVTLRCKASTKRKVTPPTGSGAPDEQKPQPKVCRVSGGADGRGRLLRRHQATLQRRRQRPGGGDGLVPLSSPAASRALVEPEPPRRLLQQQSPQTTYLFSQTLNSPAALPLDGRRGCC